MHKYEEYLRKLQSKMDFSDLVKLYGNDLTCNDNTIKQINKHLVETVGK